jgi:hypothetical protein
MLADKDDMVIGLTGVLYLLFQTTFQRSRCSGAVSRLN